MTAKQIAYRKYLESDHWKALRESVLERDGLKCTRCASTNRLQAHHKFYRHRFEDSEKDDLVTLCQPCHRKEHGIGQPKPLRQKFKPKHKRNKIKEQRHRIKNGFRLSKKELKNRARKWKYEVRRGNWSF